MPKKLKPPTPMRWVWSSGSPTPPGKAWAKAPKLRCTLVSQNPNRNRSRNRPKNLQTTPPVNPPKIQKKNPPESPNGAPGIGANKKTNRRSASQDVPNHWDHLGAVQLNGLHH